MHRRVMLTFGMFLGLAAFGGESRAQWGYGYYPYGYGGYGWGGWGGTVQGDVARGLGYFNIGAGIYNHETAIAWSINTDTVIRWNEYVYLSQRQGTREYFARRNAAISMDKNAYDALLKRIQDNPTTADVDSGDALNAVLHQLSDPRIHPSALRMVDSQISAKMIREIPFRNSVEAVTFSLSQLKASTQWPAVLFDPRFVSDRAKFETLVDEVRNDSTHGGQISPRTLSKMRVFTSRLKEKLMALPLEDKAENQEAVKFVKTLAALTSLLEKPDTGPVLEALTKMERTSVGNLLTFLRTFNLRLAPATTSRQREVYRDLYPILDQTRDRILAQAKLDNKVTDKARKADRF